MFVRDQNLDVCDLSRDGSQAAPSLKESQAGRRVQPDTVLRIAALSCAVAILWLATRHYFGIVQDARFYMVEVLRNLAPASFAGDMYFKFGSQGSFSLFTHLYLPFVTHFGAGAAGMAFTIAGQICWISGLILLARNCAGGRYLWLSVATVIATPGAYAFFSYGEDFATPRLFAEALTMLALALLRSRPAWTMVLLLFSAALHPLMALPGLVAVFVYFALGRPVLWLAAPLGAALAGGLGWAGVRPFADLLRTIDSAWFSIIQTRSAQCLLTSWSSGSYTQLLGVFFWAGVALVLVGGHERRFMAAVLVAGVAGLICALIGGDLARNVFVVELQPWRSLWLLLLMSRIYTPVVFGLVLARSSVVAEKNLNPFVLATVFTVGLILVTDTARLIRYPYAAEFGDFSMILVIGALAVIFVQLALNGDKYRRLRQASLGLAIVLVPTAALGWDQRTPWTKFLESPEPPPTELTALLPRNASIYWEGGVEMPWLKLKRSSYFSCEQGTGVMFHRETAMAYKHRLDSFWPLRLGDLDPTADCRGFDLTHQANRTRAGLQNVCRREPGLDYLAMMTPIPGVPSRVWKSPAIFQDIHLVGGKIAGQATDRFYVYSCAGLR